VTSVRADARTVGGRRPVVTRSAVWADLRLVPNAPPGRPVLGELGGTIPTFVIFCGPV